MQSTILVPIDFSPSSRVAAHSGAAIGYRLGAPVVLLHVVQELPLVDAVPAIQEAYEQAVVDRAAALMGELVDELNGAGHPVRSEIIRGEVVTRLLAESARLHAQLIVIGTSGRSDSEPFFLGSVTAALARSARAPILAVRVGMNPQITADGHFHRPLVAIDYSRFSSASIELASTLSAPDAVVELFHAAFAPDFVGAMGDETDSVYDAVSDYYRGTEATRLAELATSAGIPQETKTTVVAGRASEQIRGYIAAEPIDVVITGAHGSKTATDLLIGTVADRLLRGSPVPVLLIPDGAV